MTTSSYKILIATQAHREDIINYLRRIFFKDEPLNSYLELVTEDNPTCPSLEEFTLKHLDDGVNLMAMQNNKIIGICLCTIMEKGKEERFDCENKKYNKIVNILEYAEMQCNPFEIYPKYIKGSAVQVISIDENFRGKGIALELIRKACEISKKRGLEFMNMTCTGAYSGKLAKKLGFELKYSLNYSDYKENGKVIFKPEPPHTTLSVYLKKL